VTEVPSHCCERVFTAAYLEHVTLYNTDAASISVAICYSFVQKLLKNLLLGYKTPYHTSQETHYVSATEPGQLMLCKIWGFHGRDYEECRLLGYKNPVRTSQKTYYVSATQSSQMMLCKVSGFQGGDYEEYRLLGYKNRILTSQKTHYFSPTEPSQLKICNIQVFTAVTMKYVVFCDIKPQFLLHRRHVTSPLQSPAS
jgi:hypothetical protein